MGRPVPPALRVGAASVRGVRRCWGEAVAWARPGTGVSSSGSMTKASVMPMSSGKARFSASLKATFSSRWKTSRVYSLGTAMIRVVPNSPCGCALSREPLTRRVRSGLFCRSAMHASQRVWICSLP